MASSSIQSNRGAFIKQIFYLLYLESGSFYMQLTLQQLIQPDLESWFIVRSQLGPSIQSGSSRLLDIIASTCNPPVPRRPNFGTEWVQYHTLLTMYYLMSLLQELTHITFLEKSGLPLRQMFSTQSSKPTLCVSETNIESHVK